MQSFQYMALLITMIKYTWSRLSVSNAFEVCSTYHQKYCDPVHWSCDCWSYYWVCCWSPHSVSSLSNSWAWTHWSEGTGRLRYCGAWLIQHWPTKAWHTVTYQSLKNNFQNLNFTDKFGLQGNQINIIYMINEIKMNCCFSEHWLLINHHLLLVCTCILAVSSSKPTINHKTTNW